MKNVFGNQITISLFGESHGDKIGVMIDGLAPGLDVDMDFMRRQLELRKPHGKISTQRVETDEPFIVSGVFEGKTTGTPVCILFENNNTKSSDYTKTIAQPRVKINRRFLRKVVSFGKKHPMQTLDDKRNIC